MSQLREITEVDFPNGTPSELEILRFGLWEIAGLAPGGHADPENPCYGVKREFKEYAQRILDAADPAVGHDVPKEGGGTRAHLHAERDDG